MANEWDDWISHAYFKGKFYNDSVINVYDHSLCIADGNNKEAEPQMLKESLSKLGIIEGNP